jgi:putative ABC transport system permease protein
MRLVLRNLYRQKIYTLINLTGMSVGLAGAFLLLLYVSNELRFDRFHAGLEQIYRINTVSFDHQNAFSSAPFVLSTTLKGDLPPDYKLARTMPLQTSRILFENELIPENAIFCADPELFQVLSFQITGGSLEAFDGGPQSAVISESMAKRYFGQENPVGQSLRLENQDDEFDLDIVAVFKDVPGYSSFRPDLLISHRIALQQLDKLVISSSAEPLGADYFAESWNMFIFFTSYVRLPEGASGDRLQELMDSYPGKQYEETLGFGFVLQKYADIHFGSDHITGQSGGGNKKSIYIYSAVAMLLLLTATLNFILLSIASLERRKREMGLKMIHGAAKKQVVRQILFETILFSIVGMIAGLTLTELLLPYISETLFEKQLSIHYVRDWPFTLAVLGISLVSGIAAGAFLSRNVLSEKALKLVQQSESGGKGRMGFARVLSMVQLAISMALMICAGVIISQLNYFACTDMGFDMKDVISISLKDKQAAEKVDALQERIAALPGAAQVSGAMWTPPTAKQMDVGVRLSGDPDKVVNMEGLMVDYNIVNTLGMHLVEGRDFDPALGSENGNLIANRSAVAALGLEDQALGATMNFGTIIGIVEDFHLHSLHSQVPPMILLFNPFGIKTILVKSLPGEVESLLAGIETQWDEITGGVTFEYTFLSDTLKELYAGESRFFRILGIFAALNLFISLLGIFGMTRLGTERRTREVGIRKVLGADSTHLLNRFLREYLIRPSCRSRRLPDHAPLAEQFRLPWPNPGCRLHPHRPDLPAGGGLHRHMAYIQGRPRQSRRRHPLRVSLSISIRDY